jgi:hypothetical protein
MRLLRSQPARCASAHHAHHRRHVVIASSLARRGRRGGTQIFDRQEYRGFQAHALFKSEGYHCAELERLLLGFAYKRTIGLSPAEAKTTARRWLSYWLDQLAVYTRATSRAASTTARRHARMRATRPSAQCPLWTLMTHTPLCRRRRRRRRRRCSALLLLPLLLAADAFGLA